MTTVETPTASPRQRLSADERSIMATSMAEDYNGGMSIRLVGEKYGRSYGAAHRMLSEQGVTLRARGGRSKAE